MRRVHSIVLLLLIIAIACKKEVDNDTVDLSSSLIERSRTYFEREVSTKEDNRQMAAENSKKNDRH